MARPSKGVLLLHLSYPLREVIDLIDPGRNVLFNMSLDEARQRLADYEQSMRREVALLDSLIHGCYTGFARFELMTAFSMLYFAAATFSEHRRRTGRNGSGHAFLNADNPGFTEAVTTAYATVQSLAGKAQLGPREASDYHRDVAGLIAQFNVAGLCDPARRNMYPYLEIPPTC